MTIFKTISEARASLTSLVDEVSEGSDPVTITVKGKPKAVIISPEELDSLRETLDLLSNPKIAKDLRVGLREAKEGKGTPLKEFDWN